MNIINPNYNWINQIISRQNTKYLVIHHRAGTGDVKSLHNQHLSQGWSGIGYHFYIRKDGSVYSGRPLNSIGSHCKGHNLDSIGICFEGNYELEKVMSDAQLKAGKELITYIKSIYPNIKTVKHKDLFATACPGKNFPFDDLIKPLDNSTELTEPNDIIWELSHRHIITNVELWLKMLESNEDIYWLTRKTVKYLRKNNI